MGLSDAGQDSRPAPLPLDPPLPYSVWRSSPLLLVLAIILSCADNFADPDLWMHIKVGQLIVATGRVPVADLYSYSAAGLPWRNHEWLAQVLLAVAYSALGVVGLKLLKLLCAATVVLALSIGLSATVAPARVQRMVLLATAAGIMVQMQFRPQLFTFAMLSILMATLAREVYRGPVRLWPLIPMFAVWANLHGGWAMGLAALSICAAVLGIQQFCARREITRALRIAGVAAGCALATLLNPFGAGPWVTVLGSLSNPLIRPVINDWVPLAKFIVYQWHGSPIQVLPGAIALALFAGYVASLVVAPALDDAALTAPALLLIAAAFYANRNVALALIALSIPFAHHIGLALGKHAPSAHDQDSAGPKPGLVAVMALALALADGIFSNHLETWEQVPRGAVDFMKARGLHGNILNNFDWGEYLIWYSEPQSRVFVDGRYELVYPDALLLEYLKFLYGLPGGEKLLDRYPHDFVLAKLQTGAYRLVSADSRWRLIYRDSFSALFARSSVRPPDHAEVPVSPDVPSSSFP